MADAIIMVTRREVHMDVALVITVRARPKHGMKDCAGVLRMASRTGLAYADR